jgi:hydrogenase nickel incorporation protein HypA/HybF
MHELSVMSHLLERVETHAERLGASRVVAINLVIGDRTSIVDDSLLFYFDMLTPGTVAEGAQLKVRRTRTTCHCSVCAQDFVPDGYGFRCPACETLGTVTNDGSEFLIESLEVQQ